MPFQMRPSLGRIGSSSSSSVPSLASSTPSSISSTSTLSTPSSSLFSPSPLTASPRHGILEEENEDDTDGDDLFHGACSVCKDAQGLDPMADACKCPKQDVVRVTKSPATKQVPPRPPIVIEDEQVDENPFDPSVADESWYQIQQLEEQLAKLRMKGTRPIQTSPRSPNGPFNTSPRTSHNLLSRVISHSQYSSPRIDGSSNHGPQTPANSPVNSPRHHHSFASHELPLWRLKWRLPWHSADTHLTEEAEPSSESGEPQPGVLISCQSPSSAHSGLVTLQEAQGREDIMRRPEGFMMATSSAT